MIARDITRDCEVLIAVALAVLGIASATAARAQLDVGASANDLAIPCAAEAEVRQRLRAHVDDERELLGLAFAIDVQSNEAGLRLTLDTERDGERGTRLFEGATCSEVVDAAVLLLTLMLEAAAEEPPPAPAVQLPPEPLPPAPMPPKASVPRVRATVRAALLGELGYLPRAGLGAELGAGVAFGASRLELHGVWLPAVHSARNEDGARVAIGLWAARPGYCHRLFGRSLSLFGCVGLELGRASGRGSDLSLQRERAYLWSAGHASLRASLALGRHVSLLLEPALAVPFARRRFVSVDAEGVSRAALHTAAPVSGRVAIAFQASF